MLNETNLILLFLSLQLALLWLTSAQAFSKDITEKLTQPIIWLSRIGFFTLLAAIIFRGITLNRFPLSNLYESLLFLALALSAVEIFLDLNRKAKAISIAVQLSVFAILALAFSLPEVQRAATPLLPALKSYWRWIHVPPLMLSYAFFLIAALLGGNILVQHYVFKREADKQGAILIDKCINFGFPLLSFGIITGAFWANLSWGNLWQWDPKENLALISWLLYAALIHLRVNGKLSNIFLSWMTLLGSLAIFITYIGINYLNFGGLHTYANT